jgi:hypothetical protein
LTGVPVFGYNTDDNTDEELIDAGYALLKAGDAANYIMGAGTAGDND